MAGVTVLVLFAGWRGLRGGAAPAPATAAPLGAAAAARARRAGRARLGAHRHRRAGAGDPAADAAAPAGRLRGRRGAGDAAAGGAGEQHGACDRRPARPSAGGALRRADAGGLDRRPARRGRARRARSCSAWCRCCCSPSAPGSPGCCSPDTSFIGATPCRLPTSSTRAGDLLLAPEWLMLPDGPAAGHGRAGARRPLRAASARWPRCARRIPAWRRSRCRSGC